MRNGFTARRVPGHGWLVTDSDTGAVLAAVSDDTGLAGWVFDALFPVEVVRSQRFGVHDGGLLRLTEHE